MKWDKIKNSNTFRILFISFLILLLLIPMGMVESLIHERGHLYRQASSEITTSWGGEQLLIGPVLTLPFVRTFTSNKGWTANQRNKHLQPNNMNINADIATEIRYRGIYKVPVYTATLEISGDFTLIEPKYIKRKNSHVQLNEGIINIPIQGSRSIKKPIKFYWDNEEINLTPASVEEHEYTPTFDTIIFDGKIPERLLKLGEDHSFRYHVTLAGSELFAFLSSAKHTNISINSNWASPSFYGSHLPRKHKINNKGFNATWEINDIISEIIHEDSEELALDWIDRQSTFGVRLVQPVDTYQTVMRAAKYAILFIGLTFLVYFFTELYGKVLLHPIQYLFVGVANCVFYLLLLSLAEHISFFSAYFISAFASIILISLYSKSILKNRKKAFHVFYILSGLYIYLYVTLRSEGFALIIGSVGIFSILGISMYLTRNIDWSKMRTETVEEEK